MSHILMVGCTGMLSDVITYAAQHFQHLTLIARNAERLQEIVKKHKCYAAQFQTYALDYRQNATLIAALEQATKKAGAFTAAVCWIHGSAPKAPLLVADFLHKKSSLSNKLPYYHICSSAVANPALTSTHSNFFAQLSNIHYHQIILGFQLTANGSRWLTHDEISQETIRAMQQNVPVYVVGRVRPWSKRP